MNRQNGFDIWCAAAVAAKGKKTLVQLWQLINNHVFICNNAVVVVVVVVAGCNAHH